MPINQAPLCTLPTRESKLTLFNTPKTKNSYNFAALPIQNMKKLLILLFTLAMFTDVNAQLDCQEEFTCRVTAASGMRIRSKPSLKASMAGSVPYDSLVTACRETFGTMTYEDMQGYWRKVLYRGKVGYMFDGFLEIVAIDGQEEQKYEKLNELGDSTMADKFGDSTTSGTSAAATESSAPAKNSLAHTTESTKFDFVTEAYNFCGDIKDIDPTLLWYGFYPKDEKVGPNLRIKEVELNVVMSKTRVGKSGVEFDIETNQEERSIFLLGLNRPLEIKNLNIPDHSEKLRYAGRKIFPGQEFVLSEGPQSMKLGATGSVNSSGPCPELKDYKLILTGEKFGAKIPQDITAELLFKGQCGMPEIYWYGDFTGDGIPEIIFVSVYDEKNHFTLFISTPNAEKTLLKKQEEWVIDKCY